MEYDSLTKSTLDAPTYQDVIRQSSKTVKTIERQYQEWVLCSLRIICICKPWCLSGENRTARAHAHTCMHLYTCTFSLSLTHTHTHTPPPPPPPHDIHKTITHSCLQRLLLYPKGVVLKVLLFCSQCQCIQKKKHTAFYALCVIVNNKDLFDLIWSAMLQRRSKIKYNVCVWARMFAKNQKEMVAFLNQQHEVLREHRKRENALLANKPEVKRLSDLIVLEQRVNFVLLLRISEGIVLGPDWWLNILFRG